MSLEQYIAKRKRADGLNEFDSEHRVRNMGLCISYVIEYFVAYLDPGKVNYEKAIHSRKAAKLKKQLSKEYDSDVADWLLDIYQEHGNRIDIFIRNFIKSDLTRLLCWEHDEWARLATEFIQVNAKKLPYLAGEEEMATKAIGNYIKIKNVNGQLETGIFGH